VTQGDDLQDTARGRRIAQSLAAMLSCVLVACFDAPAAAAGESTATPAPPAAVGSERPDVLLVTLDTARADRIGAYGYTGARTRHIDALAERGLLFEQAVAPTPITLPSHASILTGVLPPAHGVHDNGLFALGPQAKLVSEVFRERGWRTGAFVGAYVLDARFGLDQGFELYRGPTPDRRQQEPHSERTAPEVTADVLEWLASLEADEPFFAWVHFYDPHFPYTPSVRYPKLDPYDGELARCDAHLGRILKLLREIRPGREPVVLVTSDHGEGLGDHGERTHGLLLYQPTLRVPLVIAGPGVTTSPGRRIMEDVSTAAVAATLLDAAGIWEGGEGAGLHETSWPSLLSAAPERTASAPPRAVYFENHLPYHAHRWRAARGIVDGGFKLIAGGTPELYALRDDPDEARDLAASDPLRSGVLERRLDEVLAASASLGWAVGRDVDAGERALLESLGYLESSRGADPFSDELPDVRERMADLEVLREAKALIEHAVDRGDDPVASAVGREQRDAQVAGVLQRAAELLAPVRARNPHSPAVARRLSRIERMRGDFGAAAALLEEVVKAHPFGVEDRFALALVYEEMGRSDDALREVKALERLAPDYGRAVEWLAAHHCQRADRVVCETWLLRVIDTLTTDHPRGRDAQRALDALREKARSDG